MRPALPMPVLLALLAGLYFVAGKLGLSFATVHSSASAVWPPTGIALGAFLLAGDAIYSSKHLSAYMKEAFAEDILREAEKMERYASIERPEQIEATGITGDMMRAPRLPHGVVPATTP